MNIISSSWCTDFRFVLNFTFRTKLKHVAKTGVSARDIFKGKFIDYLFLDLQEDERNQDILNEKLSRLNRKEQHDPVLALGRDNVYEEELWEEHFEEWESGKDSSFDHVVKSNASQLCAVAAMRTIEMAQAQHRKYIKTYRSLEKTGKSYKKVSTWETPDYGRCRSRAEFQFVLSNQNLAFLKLSCSQG